MRTYDSDFNVAQSVFCVRYFYKTNDFGNLLKSFLYGTRDLIFVGAKYQSQKNRIKKRTVQFAQFFWRRERDSNPRYAYDVHTISNRAP